MYTLKRIHLPLFVNTLLLVTVVAFCPFRVNAQTRYKPVQKTTGSNIDKKAIVRDLTLYPLTESGTANFIAAISACSLPIITRPVAGAVVGTYSYAFSDNRRDVNNQLFVSDVAPVLISRERNAPRLIGNHYSFTPQQALNTALLARIEPFQVHQSKIIVYPGANFQNMADRSTIFTRGFNAVAESVPDPTTLSGNRGVYLGAYYELADERANQLGPNDPSYQWLKEAGNQSNPRFIDNEVAGKAFGRHVYSSLLNNPGWSNGEGILAFCPDFEIHQANPRSGAHVTDQWRNMVGYFMEGTKEGALAAGKTPPLFIPYDHANMTPASLNAYDQEQPQSGVFYDEGNGVYNIFQPEVGVPVYMHPTLLEPPLRGTTRAAPMNANGPLGQYIKNNPSAMGSQEYMHYTGDDQTYFQKNSDGSFIVDEQNGRKTLRWRTDGRRTMAFGQVADIVGANPPYYNGEYFDLVYETYERIAQAVTAQYFRAGGKHLPLSTDRQPGWEHLKLQQWFRFDREFKSPERLPSINPATGQPYDQILLNKQQLYAPMLARDVMIQYILRDVLRFWMEGQGTIVTQGQNKVDIYPDRTAERAPQSIGSIEVVSNALYRASRFDYLHDANTPWRLICPRFWIKNNLPGKSWYDRLESFEKKPLLLGGIVPNHNGKTKLWMLWSYPAQDVEKKTEVLVWVDKNDGAGPVTPAYRLLLSGRSTGLDDWVVPPGVASAEPKHIKFQFTDMTGEKQTWTGDYRIPVLYGNDGPNPPAVTSITE